MVQAQAACAGQLVLIPSYFDYGRVRALAKAVSAGFAALSEYAQVRTVVRQCCSILLCAIGAHRER